MKFFDKVNKIKISSSQKFELFPFCRNSKFLEDFPIKWGMTFKKAGSMRFRWNEENLLRDKILLEISEKYFAAGKEDISIMIFDIFNINNANKLVTLTGNKDNISVIILSNKIKIAIL